MKLTLTLLFSALTAMTVKAASNNPAEIVERCDTCDDSQQCDIDTTGSKPYVRFIVSDTEGKGNSTTILDIADCGTVGLKNGIQWHSAGTASPWCKTYVLWKLSWMGSWGIQVSDTDTWYGWDVDNESHSTPRFMPFDPVWQESQQWTFEGCNSCNDNGYFGKNCFIKSTLTGKCLQAKGLTAASPQEKGGLQSVDCSTGSPTKFDLLESSVGTQDNHNHKFDNLPTAPEGY